MRDYIHIIGLANAYTIDYEGMVNRTVSNDVFNLGNDSGYSVKEIIDICQKYQVNQLLSNTRIAVLEIQQFWWRHLTRLKRNLGGSRSISWKIFLGVLGCGIVVKHRQFKSLCYQELLKDSHIYSKV